MRRWERFYAYDVLGITDKRVLSGIWYHCTGRPAMPLEEKIVYLADALEPGRNYEGVEKLRPLAKGKPGFGREGNMRAAI